MIERYTPKEIGIVWSDEEKFRRFLKIEILFCQALEKFKEIPQGVSKKLEKAKISLSRIKKIEAKTHHDIVAFLKSISSGIGSAASYLHLGLTSSDLLDTTLAWQIKDATEIILQDLDLLMKEVQSKALKYKDTLCIARTHGVHAESYALGLKFLYFYNDLKEERRLLKESLNYTACGKISGAVGTFAYFEPKIEEYICKKIGVSFAPISTQIVSRERFAYYLSILSLIGSTLERFATEIRHLHRNEVNEVKEPFYKGQKGSSAMPHKQNPIICERICGLARVLRANSLVAFENINLWHERDISHSSAERIILPDSTIALDYILRKFKEVIKNLTVNPKNMLRNMELNRGLIYSQKILLKLMGKGLSRMKAYDYVQDVSLKVINENSNFKEESRKDRQIRKYLSKEELDEIFNPYEYLKNIDKIYKRVGL
ncbi:MAG: adenylosuccinate lyase [Candidatus Omnitrophica bacterium]|nr:adenylosuccinate lyase [Candidatus Omnitrophota bacterium]MBU1133727.1 adenylosuccinate lyase [Candidatus Omnitrophota bacterium]MBU1811067.1 adenylosuccinate lyase [Candidatus Omnitrophota bacterium]